MAQYQTITWQAFSHRASSAVCQGDLYVNSSGPRLSSGQSVNDERRVSALYQSCFWQLCQLWLVRSLLTSNTAKTLVHAFISSCLYYCNSLLYGVSDGLQKKLQAIENITAWLVTAAWKFGNIMLVLHELHWLQSIRKSSTSLRWLHVSTQLGADILSRRLFSNLNHCWQVTPAGTSSLSVPRTRNMLETRSFAVAGPVIWNSLPTARQSATLPPPPRYLKAHLFAACLRTIYDVLYKSTHHHHQRPCVSIITRVWKDIWSYRAKVGGMRSGKGSREKAVPSVLCFVKMANVGWLKELLYMYNG